MDELIQFIEFAAERIWTAIGSFTEHDSTLIVLLFIPLVAVPLNMVQAFLATRLNSRRGGRYEGGHWIFDVPVDGVYGNRCGDRLQASAGHGNGEGHGGNLQQPYGSGEDKSNAERGEHEKHEHHGNEHRVGGGARSYDVPLPWL